ncbi:MAG: AraC family transcriptional regulator [Armatimonadota bacterium]
MHTICGMKGKESDYIFESTDYDHFQVIFVLQGELIITVQNIDTALPPGWVAVLPVGSSFRLRCKAVGYQGIFASLFDTQGQEYTGTACGMLSSPELRTLVGLMAAEVSTPAERTDEIVQSLGIALGECSIRLLHSHQQEIAADAESWVRHACRSIEKTIYTNQPLEQRLAGIPLSYRQLSRYFHRIVGVTPKQYEMHSRVQEAKRLLTSTRLSITSIALELGFASSQHFSTQFTHLAGMPPSEYRCCYGHSNRRGIEAQGT